MIPKDKPVRVQRTYEGLAGIFNAINDEAAAELEKRGPCETHGAPYPAGNCYLCGREHPALPPGEP